MKQNLKFWQVLGWLIDPKISAVLLKYPNFEIFFILFSLIRDSWPRDLNIKTLVEILLSRLAVAVCWVLCYVPIFSFYCSRFLWWRQIRHYIHNTLCHYYPNLTHFSCLLFGWGSSSKLNPQLSKKSARRLITVVSVHIIWTNDRRWPPCN